ncbi:MAG TPA: hypothetical protein HA257_06950 [Candidatus Methanoperedenaceae archaeon]|nr:hypothetical protein [Candidatus Methanoperedenaceae archaeon]
MGNQGKVILILPFLAIAVTLFTTVASSAISLNFGETISGSIDPAGEIDTYTFSTTADDRILIRVVSLTPEFSPVIVLRGLNGTEIKRASGFRAFDLFIEQVLPSTGTYTVQVYSGGTAKGNYSLYASSLLAPQSTVAPRTTSPAPAKTQGQNTTAPIREIPSLIIPAATAGIITLLVGIMSTFFEESLLHGLSVIWEKIDKVLRKFLGIGGKYTWEDLEKKFLAGENVEIPENNLWIAIGGVIIFLAFLIELTLYSHETPYDASSPIFIVSLAFFVMLAEIGHDLVARFSLQSMGGKKLMELSLLGSVVTILTGIMGFVVTAVLSSKVLRKSENIMQEAVVTLSGSIFNLLVGMLVLLVTLVLNIKWLALAGAMPNLAYATFSLLPFYPFEGKAVIKGSIWLWGLMFFVSMMLYIYVILL